MNKLQEREQALLQRKAELEAQSIWNALDFIEAVSIGGELEAIDDAKQQPAVNIFGFTDND